jgi:hypothetical protein
LGAGAAPPDTGATAVVGCWGVFCIYFGININYILEFTLNHSDEKEFYYITPVSLNVCHKEKYNESVGFFYPVSFICQTIAP